ncbi:hypothetical protein HKD37_16G044943 [Glycine soja]
MSMRDHWEQRDFESYGPIKQVGIGDLQNYCAQLSRGVWSYISGALDPLPGWFSDSRRFRHVPSIASSPTFKGKLSQSENYLSSQSPIDQEPQFNSGNFMALFNHQPLGTPCDVVGEFIPNCTGFSAIRTGGEDFGQAMPWLLLATHSSALVHPWKRATVLHILVSRIDFPLDLSISFNLKGTKSPQFDVWWEIVSMSCKCLVNVDIMHYFGIDSKAVELLVKNSSHLRRMKVEGSKLWCCKNLGVKVFWVGDTWMWDFKWRRRWFEWETFLVTTINHMLANVRIQKQGRDSWWWLDDNTGIYSVKYGYRVLHNLLMGSQPTEAFSMIWKLKVPKKVICLVWREYSWIDCQLRTI